MATHNDGSRLLSSIRPSCHSVSRVGNAAPPGRNQKAPGGLAEEQSTAVHTVGLVFIDSVSESPRAAPQYSCTNVQHQSVERAAVVWTASKKLIGLEKNYA